MMGRQMLDRMKQREGQLWVVLIGLAVFGLVGLGVGLLPAGSPAAGSAPPEVGGCAVFPASTAPAGTRSAADQTAWNQDVSRAPVAKNSKRIVRQINRDGDNFLHPDFGSNPDYGIPYEVVEVTQPDVDVEIGPRGYPDESDFGPAPIPPKPPARIEVGSDHHVLVVQKAECGLYELYRARYLGDNRWQADSTAFFDLGAAGPLRPDGWTSADAAGLPVLPGLVRYDEVAAGALEHAIRITFEETRRAYIHPATHYASDSCKRTRPAMGIRLRLRPAYFREHFRDYPPGSQSRVIFTALYRYGAIVADNGSNWFISGATDARWDDEDLNRLKEVPGRAFQIVRSAARPNTPC